MVITTTDTTICHGADDGGYENKARKGFVLARRIASTLVWKVGELHHQPGLI